MGNRKVLSASAMVLAVILLATTSLPAGSAQNEDVLLDPLEVGIEVLLNDPQVKFDTSVLSQFIIDGYIRLPGWNSSSGNVIDPSGPFLFLSHYNKDLGVIIQFENLTDHIEMAGIEHSLAGYTISIIIPRTIVDGGLPGTLDDMVRPDGDIDIESMDWTEAMKIELEWLIDIGALSGIEQGDIVSISELSERGTMGPNNRVIFHLFSGKWKLYNQTGLPEIILLMGGPDVYSREDLPTSVAPYPDNTEKINFGLIISIALVTGILLLIASSFYHRVNRAIKINNARRKLIFETIKRNPGIYFRALMKDLDIKPGVASYHLNRLEKEEFIKSFQDGMYRRFFLYDDKVEVKVMLSDVQALIVDVIKEEPGISQVELSKMIGKSKVVINYNVRFLRDLGLLLLERDGRKTHCFLTFQGSKYTS